MGMWRHFVWIAQEVGLWINTIHPLLTVYFLLVLEDTLRCLFGSSAVHLIGGEEPVLWPSEGRKQLKALWVGIVGPHWR